MLGKTISHYKVLEKIGQGGMGEVYRAEDTNLSREVAIKVLPEQFTQDPERLARFEREAKLLASLNHPNIAAIYGFEHSDDFHFLVLELVPGDTLAERLAKGPLPVEEALDICRQIAEGVEAAHQKGVIHRDLKPANVKVTPEGQVKILDFGLAKAFEAESIPVTDFSQSPTLTEEMTRAGVILGTAAYMSPEQARGKPVDKRADIFAFGSVLFELLTGKRAFEGETVTDTIASVLKGEPEWDLLPQSIPSTIRFLISRCLQKDPGKRLQHIDGARILIEEALSGATTASQIGLSSAIQPPLWRRAIPWSIAVAAIVTGVSIAFWSSPQPLSPPSTKFVITPSLTAPLANTIDNDLAISADGRQLAYLAVGERGNQLYLRSLSDFVDKPIPGTEGINYGSSFFSPDGATLAFFAGNELKKVSLVAGSLVTICDCPLGRSGSWGSDDTIVFSADHELGLALYRVSAAGGEREILATVSPDEGENSFTLPQLLTGGKALLFTIERGPGKSQIAVLSLETGERKILIEDGSQAQYTNTGHLIYEQVATGNLMAVPFDLATLAVTGDSVPVLQGVRRTTPGYLDYALSDEGTLVYVPAQADVQRLVWVDRKGTESLIIQDEVSFGSPRISPDGKQVALAITKSGETQNIWIYALESESLRRLTFEGGSVETWSPDGKWIVFSGRDSEGLRAISRQLADGSGPVEHLTVPTPAPLLPGSLTPDGSV
ncbi:MAG: protein kinase, partial [Acidobacteria bacterium]|nr:protein kinase [Acidobacteriota bacterium]